MDLLCLEIIDKILEKTKHSSYSKRKANTSEQRAVQEICSLSSALGALGIFYYFQGGKILALAINIHKVGRNRERIKTDKKHRDNHLAGCQVLLFFFLSRPSPYTRSGQSAREKREFHHSAYAQFFSVFLLNCVQFSHLLFPLFLLSCFLETF